MIDETKRKHIILSIIAAVVILALLTIFSLSRKGTLQIFAPPITPDNSSVTVQIFRGEREVQSFSLSPGETKKIRLDTGIVRVDGQAGSLKSVDIIQIKGFSATKLETPAGEQRAIRQLASDAKYCPIIAKEITYSYACDSEGPIIRHTSNEVGSSLNTPLFNGTSFSNLKPLKNGLIGFYATAGSPTDLLYIDLDTHTAQIVRLPQSIQALLVNQPRISVTSNPTSSRFALLFSGANKAYMFQDINDSRPVELKPGEGVRLDEDGRLSNLSFYGNQLILYMGVSAEIGEGEVMTSGPADIPDLTSYVFEYSLDGKLTDTITLPENLDAQGVYKLSNEFYTADQPYGFSFYRRDGNSLQFIYSIADISSWTIMGNTAYVMAGGTLYEFRPREGGAFGLRSLFASSDITVSELYSGVDSVLFTGLADNSSDAPLNIYELLPGKEGNQPQGDNKDSGTGQSTAPTTAVEPSYSGLDDLLYHGVSSFQIANLRFALSSYTASSATHTTSVAITNIQPEPHDRFSESTVSVINFDATINGTTTVRAKLEYFDLRAIRLYLYNKDTGGLIHDSQAIGHTESQSYNPEPQH